MGRGLKAMTVALCLPVLASGCAVPAPGPAEPRPPAPRPVVHLLMTATAHGAVLLDRKSNSYVGVDRSNRRVWTDRDAAGRGASVVCLASCPDAVVSGAVPPVASEPAPMLYKADTRAPFTVPAARNRTVLTARSAGDAIVAETDAQGRHWLHLLRPGGDRRIRLDTPEVGWFESPDGTTALLLPRTPAGTTTVRWFVRDGAGWQATGNGFDAAQLRDACVVRGGRTAILTGPEPLLIRDGTHAVPLRTDLSIISECSVGEQSGAVLSRSFTGVSYRTDVRGIDPNGALTWSRGYDSEAVVATDPAGERTAIAHDGVLDVLDRSGQVVHNEHDVDGVRFTPDGRLVIVTRDGTVRWLE